MPSQAHPVFTDIVNKIYIDKIGNLDSEVDEFLNSNSQIKTLLSQEKIQAESIIPQVLSLTFFKCLGEAVEQVYQKAIDKKEITVVFDFSKYVDYMINELESKDENGPFLAANFIKKINDIHDFPKTLKINYRLSFDSNGLLAGYIDFNKSDCLTAIKKAYKEVISIPMKESIIEELSNTDDFLELHEIDSFAHDLTHHILQKKFNSDISPIHYHFYDFKELLSYSSHLVMDGKKMTTEKGIVYLQKILPDLALVKKPLQNANTNFKIK